MTPLLLLVDLQRDYLAVPELEPAEGMVVRSAAALLEGCREIGVPVTHVWTTVSRSDDRRMPHWKRDGRWLCEEGTPGHAPPPALEPLPGEGIVHKTSYSAFSSGDLDRVLGANGIDLVVVAGVHLHACVRQAVLDAYERHGVEIWVAEDATASDDALHAAITRRYLERRAARFLPVSEVLDGLRSSGNGAARTGRGEDVVGDVANRCRVALGAWRDADAGERVALLERLAGRLEPEVDELTRELADRIGKPARYGSVEVSRTAQMLRAVAEHARRTEAEAAAGAEIRRPPLGVVAAVTPWNNPVYIPLGKIAAALAHGNAVLWKPAPAAHAISERLMGMLDAAGAPEGLVGLVGGGRRAAEAAMSDPGVDAVTLTGSSEAGFAAQEACARRRIPLQAELGGNNAAIVWPDADLDDAASEIAEGAFAIAGQRCTANRRVVVHRDCRERLLELLRAQTAALAWGDPRDPQTRVGPLISAAKRDQLAELLAGAGLDAGDVVAPHGAAAPPVDGFDAAWYPPTIVSCDDPSHELVQRETFGPLLVVQTADDWDRAIELANGVRQGLVAAMFSSSAELAERFLNEAEAGVLKVNRSTADADVDVPFGGWKWSGVGPPEHGSFDRDFYTRPQAVYR